MSGRRMPCTMTAIDDCAAAATHVSESESAIKFSAYNRSSSCQDDRGYQYRQATQRDTYTYVRIKT